jgi:hypothetical protein
MTEEETHRMAKKGSARRDGPPTLYPNKVRTPVSVQLTAVCHEMQAANLARLREALGRKLSRSDYYEALERKFGEKLTPRMLPKPS